MGSKLGFVVGFASGLAVGYLLGVFSAPQAGRDTLEDIGDKAIELRGRAEQAAARVKDDVMGPLTSAGDLGAD
jgi:hypothetical protein